MTQIVAVEIHAGPAAPTPDEIEMTVIVKMTFTAREIEEDYDYGVNVHLFEYYTGAQYVVTNPDMTGMLVQYIPQPVPAPKSTYGGMVIKPGRPGVRVVRFPFKLKTAEFPAGTTLQALVSVVPEIATVFNRSVPTTMPSALPIMFPTEVSDEGEGVARRG